MKTIETSEDVNELMWGYLSSAALNIGLERGLFWELFDGGKQTQEIADLYSIPLDRCRNWLNLLTKMGLLMQENNHYTMSAISQKAIIDKYSKETWRLFAQEAREQYQTIIELNDHIVHPKSVWLSQGVDNPSYITKMEQSKDRAERFTRMLYEINQPLAEQMVERLDMTGITSLMDIGGGSGIISFALIRKHHELMATVFDIENVCAAGRKLAEENDLIHRVNYIGGNFVEDNLPTGFDMIIECDVGIYNAELFAKVMGALNPNGRFVIVSNIKEQGAWLQERDKQPSFMSHIYSFLSSLSTDKSKDLSSEDLRTILQEVGFQKITIEHVDNGVILIEGEKIVN